MQVGQVYSDDRERYLGYDTSGFGKILGCAPTRHMPNPMKDAIAKARQDPLALIKEIEVPTTVASSSKHKKKKLKKNTKPPNQTGKNGRNESILPTLARVLVLIPSHLRHPLRTLMVRAKPAMRSVQLMPNISNLCDSSALLLCPIRLLPLQLPCLPCHRRQTHHYIPLSRHRMFTCKCVSTR